MAKKEFNIQEIINLSKTIETLISDIMYKIISKNAFLKSKKDEEENIVDLYNKFDRLQDQLIVVKSAKDKVNQKKTSLGKTNQQLIYELSNLRRKESALETMLTQKLKVKNPDDYDYHISKSQISEDLDKTQARISEIKDSMTKFNNSHKVKIVIDDTLDLL